MLTHYLSISYNVSIPFLGSFIYLVAQTHNYGVILKVSYV